MQKKKITIERPNYISGRIVYFRIIFTDGQSSAHPVDSMEMGRCTHIGPRQLPRKCRLNYIENGRQDPFSQRHTYYYPSTR